MLVGLGDFETPFPLAGKGGGEADGKGVAPEIGIVLSDSVALAGRRDPLSGPSGHLFPQGEKDPMRVPTLRTPKRHTFRPCEDRRSTLSAVT